MKNLIIISSSLNKDSMSYLGMKKVEEIATNKGFNTELIDLREVEVPFCDGRKFEEYSNSIKEIGTKLESIDYIVFGTPVYCYSLSGVLKNFIDIFAKSMMNKKFGVLEQAGTKLSYLSAIDLQKIIGYECQSQPIFPVVLTDYSSYSDGILTDVKAIEKINEMLDNFTK